MAGFLTWVPVQVVTFTPCACTCVRFVVCSLRSASNDVHVDRRRNGGADDGVCGAVGVPVRHELGRPQACGVVKRLRTPPVAAIHRS